jgi:hypothetical protein
VLTYDMKPPYDIEYDILACRRLRCRESIQWTAGRFVTRCCCPIAT